MSFDRGSDQWIIVLHLDLSDCLFTSTSIAFLCIVIEVKVDVFFTREIDT